MHLTLCTGKFGAYNLLIYVQMKKISTAILLFTLSCICTYAQIFNENFDSYAVNSYLGPNSTDWTTWSGVEGGSEDVQITNTKSVSGSQSIYFNSPSGNGPNDVVLDFGGVHSSGRFKFSQKMYIPSNRSAYFNFQGGASTGSIWAMDIYFYTGGSYNVSGGSGSMSGSFPQDVWFEIVFDINLTTDVWEMFIDGVSQGTWNNSNNVSFLDIYPANADSEFWIDDVSFCVNSACNPELSVDMVSISPNPVCTYKPADVTVKITNHSSFAAPEMTLGLEVGPDKLSQHIKLNWLAGGKDTTITIPGMFVSSVAGSNLPVNAINIQGDVNPANDTAKTTMNVNPSPSGAATIKGSPFKSPNPSSAGTKSDPDILAAPDVGNYEITPPVGYTNSAYNTTWEIIGMSVTFPNGSAVPASYYSYSNPSASGNGKLVFTPDTLITDSTISICYTIRNKTTLCDTSVCRYIYLAPRPKAGFNPINVCDKESMEATNTSFIKKGVLTYSWDFGDGTTSDFAQPIKQYAGPGAYNVKLVVTSDYGYTDSITQVVNVYPIPVANFNFTNACEGTAVSMSDNSTLPSGTPSYLWDFGSNPPSTATGAATSKLYNAPGLYQVKLTVTVNGCSSSASKYVTQAPRTTPDFTFTPTQCDNGKVDFTNQTNQPVFGSTSFTWSFGDGESSTEASVSHAYNNFQTYDVTLVSNTDLGCKDSITKSVTLRESPTASFTQSGSECNDHPIDFTNSSLVPTGFANTYEWNFGDGNTSNVDNPTHAYSAPGTYKVILVSESSNGCTSQTETTVTIDLNPNAGFLANNVCSGNPTEFDNGSFSSDNAVLTYLWKFGNGDSSVATDPSVVYANAGTYAVTLMATHPNGCTDMIIDSVIVFQTPVVDILPTSANTGDGTLKFATTANGTGYTYYWLFGDGGSSTQQNPQYKFNFNGNWHVSLTVTTPDGCSATEVDTVHVNTVGIIETGILAGVNVYPNPSAGKFVLDFTKSGTDAVSGITVTDMLGRTVVNQVAVPVSGLAEVDLTGQAAGIYYLNIATSAGIHTVKLTVSR